MRSRIRITSCLVGIAACAPALACLNSYTQLRLEMQSEVRLIDAPRLEYMLGRTTPDHEEQLWIRRARELARVSPTPENQVDMAVALVHDGKAREAARVLRAVEARRPGRYETAANLGTALELAGDNAGALRWIRTGIQRNPHAHEGTEWLHARILQAKLAGRVPRTGSALALDFGKGPLPSLPPNLPSGNRGERVDVADLGLALRYQLIERTHFVAAPDPIVAGLLVDWAHLELLAGDRQTATVLYAAAVKYGYPETAMLRAGQVEAKRRLSPEEQAARNRNCELCLPAAKRINRS